MCIALTIVTMTGSLSTGTDQSSPGLLRMMRAFRVFRLFKRVESLRKIMQSLSKAVPGVANAFFIQAPAAVDRLESE